MNRLLSSFEYSGLLKQCGIHSRRFYCLFFFVSLDTNQR